MLIILDGWGIGQMPSADAIRSAETPFFDSLMQRYPNATLSTSGEDVGLPEGQMGNSEVGHLNIGAGRVVFQELARINMAVKDGSLAREDQIVKAIELALSKDKRVHILGLVSDGGVHSHIDHIVALANLFASNGVRKVFMHAFTDGRDTDPRSGKRFVKDLINRTENQGVRLGTVIGRYYAMDRDQRWERIKKAYDLLVHGVGTQGTDPMQAIQKSYETGVTDEFIEPIICNDKATIRNGDVVVFANFRTDRPRQLVRALTQESFEEYNMKPLKIHLVTMTNYDETFQNVHAVFDKNVLSDTMGEVLEKNGLTQVRIAETEKYPHVTFFFSGGREEPFHGESRILVPSPKVPTYDLKPEMSAFDVTDRLIDCIITEQPDFVCLNYANADMVGHTGVFQAAVEACEAVDRCLSRLIPVALKHEYEILIIADHGNSDFMINDDGTPNTAHTTNPVPIIYIGRDSSSQVVKPGRLADVAPTLLHLMSLSVPEAMTGIVLINHQKTVKVKSK